jgi:multidrug/hemolysin transport system permease protein
MEAPLNATFAGAPEEAVQSFREMMGVTFKFGNDEVSFLMSVGILVLTAVVFYLLSIINISRKKK